MTNCLDCNIKLKENEVERCNKCLYLFIFEEDLDKITQYIKEENNGKSN